MSQITLAQLVQANPCAHALILAYAHNHPLARYSDADDAHALLQSQGQPYPQSVVRGAFRDMTRCGLGQSFCVNETRGDDSGFRWSALPMVVLEALRTGTALPLDATPATDVFKPEPGDEIARTLPVHRFPLRPDCTVRLDLPGDLTRKEAKRLGMFLLSLSDNLWPFPVSGDDLDDGEHEEMDADEIEAEMDCWLDGGVPVDDLDDFDDPRTREAQPPQSEL